MKKNLEYLLARLGVMLVNSMSHRTAYRFSGWLGRRLYRLMKKRREIARDNLKQALGHKLSDEQIEKIVIGVFENLTRTFLEFPRFKKLGYEGIKKFITPAGKEYLDRANQEGRGAIILTAHFGNWEMLGGYLTQYGYKATAMVKVQHNEKVDKLINGFRKVFNIEIIYIGKTNLREVIRALKSNHFVFNLPDQHDPSESMILDFFGRKTTVARGPALFSLKTNCPIIPLLLRRDDYNRFVIMPGEPIYPNPSGDLERDVIEITRKYMKFLEDSIEKYPEQWMWTHRRWKI